MKNFEVLTDLLLGVYGLDFLGFWSQGFALFFFTNRCRPVGKILLAACACATKAASAVFQCLGKTKPMRILCLM